MDYDSADDDFEDLPPVSSLNVIDRNAPKTSQTSLDTVPHSGDESDKDEEIVAAHYNARPDEGHDARSRSAILHLRIFNNWIKNVMIQEFARGRNLKVLDLACGKGGDLGKWNKLAATHLTGVGKKKYIFYSLDIAEVSLQHARERYIELKPKYEAKFIQFDAFRKPFPPGLLPLRHYDAISCQFAFHYAFESFEFAKIAIKNVANSLTPGGYFMGTVPNADEIM